MRVIVQNEAEKRLLQKFFDYLNETGIEDMEKDDIDEWAEERVDEMWLSSDEWNLMRDNFGKYTNIVIDPKESEMYFDGDEMITGTCHKCAKRTVGTIDGDAISYSEYLRLNSPEVQQHWYCDTCWNNGSVEEDEAQQLTNSTNDGNMFEEVVSLSENKTQMQEFLESWLKVTLQGNFEESVINDMTKLSAAMKESGYKVQVSGFGEYVLMKNDAEVARIQTPLVF